MKTMLERIKGLETVPCLSLWQPWASAMALGLKRIETRSWERRYRGPILIHAAKRWTRDERDFAHAMGFEGVDLPLGAIVAVANLVDVWRTEHLNVSDLEAAWGNYGPQRFGWITRDIWQLERPVPYRGLQGLFHVPVKALGR